MFTFNINPKFFKFTKYSENPVIFVKGTKCNLVKHYKNALNISKNYYIKYIKVNLWENLTHLSKFCKGNKMKLNETLQNF